MMKITGLKLEMNNMIIDIILDRKKSKIFTDDDVECIIDDASVLGFDYIIDAFKIQNNIKIREALCRYVDSRRFDSGIKDFINTVSWVPLGGVIYDRWE